MTDENNRIITHEWAKSNSSFYTNPDINFPDKKGLTHLTVKNSISEQIYKVFTFKNYPLNQLVPKNNFKFNFIYPDYGQGFNYRPTHVTINEHPDYFKITVGGQFTMYRRISLSENCNRIININSDGSYNTYNWGGEIGLGFFGNFDTTNYSIPTIIGLETIYDNNTPYNIVSGTFTNYKYKNSYNNVISTNVSRVCAINSGDGMLCSYYNTLPTYTNATYKIKQIEDFSKPTRVLGVSYYTNTDHILTDFTIVPNASYQPTLKSTQKALVDVDRSIIKAAYLPDFSPDRTNYDAYFCGSFRIANGNSTCKYFTKINFYTGAMTSGNINLDTSYYNIIQDFDIQSDGKIIIIGDFKYNGSVYCMLRLNLDLSVDTSFTGLLTSSLNVSRGVDASSSDIKINTIAIQRLGQDKDKILIGGCFSINISNQAGGYYNQCGYAYFDKNGAIVPVWGRTSQSNITVGFWDDSKASVDRIKLLPQGDFILVGLFDTFDGVEKSGICNLRYNGTPNYDSTDIYTDVPNYDPGSTTTTIPPATTTTIPPATTTTIPPATTTTIPPTTTTTTVLQTRGIAIDLQLLYGTATLYAYKNGTSYLSVSSTNSSSGTIQVGDTFYGRLNKISSATASLEVVSTTRGMLYGVYDSLANLTSETYTVQSGEDIYIFGTVQDGGCLVAGTLVTLVDGTHVPVESLNTGDQLLSAQIVGLEDTNNVLDLKQWRSAEIEKGPASSSILEFVRETAPFTISLNDGLLTASSSHIQLVKRDNTWRFLRFGEIIVGDMLLLEDTTEVEITTISVNVEATQVYRIVLDTPSHTYYANNILTHNIK